MKEIKENKKLIIIIIFIVLIGNISSVFAYSLIASDVSFTPKDTTWNVDNAKSALDDLHIKAGELSTKYSTNEKVVGTWVDGRPIYQKTLLNMVLVHSGSYDISDLNIDNLIDIVGEVIHTNNNHVKIPYGAGNGDYVHIYLAADKKRLICALAGSWNANTPAFLTLRYVKQTN